MNSQKSPRRVQITGIYTGGQRIKIRRKRSFAQFLFSIATHSLYVIKRIGLPAHYRPTGNYVRYKAHDDTCRGAPAKYLTKPVAHTIGLLLLSGSQNY